MESQESSRIAAPLGNRVARDASAAQIAEAMVATWQEIEAALTPIVGSRGVAALYKRSLFLAGATHPWLAGTHEGDQTGIDLAALNSVVSQQSSADAALGGNVLLQTFYQLLGGLIGPSLTKRLLRSVWAETFRPPATQDTKR
jgi:hypothetical protein